MCSSVPVAEPECKRIDQETKRPPLPGGVGPEVNAERLPPAGYPYCTHVVSSPVLVGRDEELAAMRSGMSRRPCVVVVDGEAEMGKTRLVDEVPPRSTGLVL